jgi:hypothetical protein
MWGEHNLDLLKDRIFSMEAEIEAKTMALDEKKKAFDKELAEMKTQHKKVLTELSDAKAALEQEHEELKMEKMKIIDIMDKKARGLPLGESQTSASGSGRRGRSPDRVAGPSSAAGGRREEALAMERAKSASLQDELNRLKAQMAARGGGGGGGGGGAPSASAAAACAAAASAPLSLEVADDASSSLGIWEGHESGDEECPCEGCDMDRKMKRAKKARRK